MVKKIKDTNNKFLEKKCYICKKEATTREHVPPRCIFPDNKRKLPPIIVYSCKAHNNNFSKDDEFLRNIISMGYNKNKYGDYIFESKSLKSFEQRPRNINMLGKYEPIFIENILTKIFEPSAAFSTDKERFNKVIEKIARGIFFEEFKEIFVGQTTSIISNLFHDFRSKNNFEGANNIVHQLISKWNSFKLNKKGNYPEIFYYQISKKDDQIAIHMSFYEGIKIYIQMLSAF